MIVNKQLVRGAHFLVEKTESGECYIPEEFTEEQIMIQETCEAFITSELGPVKDELEYQPEGLAAKLMLDLGELGMLGSHMPEEFGGMDLDFISNSIIGEEIGKAGSFSVSYNAHTGIGMLPILYFGTEEQKKKYLPKMVTGKSVGSYCLTEPSSGSDALAAKTTAVLSEDGNSYILNGQKMWISNAGFADVFVIFAKIDGKDFTGFIVDRDTPGLSLGEEEQKMGIKGSSTRMVFLENATIPKDNVLGEIGKGHLIAFNVLNIGRYKLGVSCIGGSKGVSSASIAYANERQQFGQSIGQFGAIQHKIAEQAIQIFSAESVTYRVGGLIQEAIEIQKSEGKSYADSKLIPAEEYALECSIIKILCSEVLDYVVDEGVQIYGGMGFSEEGIMSRAYRDSRINRIFEGTNEINRLLMVKLLFKKITKGEIDLAKHAFQVQSELMEGGIKNKYEGQKYADEQKCSDDLKSLCILLLGIVGQQAMEGKINLKNEQELAMNLSDLLTESYKVESNVLRIQKLETLGKLEDHHEAIMKVCCHDSNLQSYKLAMDIIGDFVDDSMKAMIIKGMKNLTKYPVQPTKALRRNVAATLLNHNRYKL